MPLNQKDTACCSPRREIPTSQAYQNPIQVNVSNKTYKHIKVPGGQALVGTDKPQILEDGEGPLKNKRIKAFKIGVTAVTNEDFLTFVEDTGYVTEAEIFGWSFVFWAQVPEDYDTNMGSRGAQWWRRVDGANWQDVNGPKTSNQFWHPSHPVVHVSWNDALAYAKWAGGRLATEFEWEHAARGGLGDVPYPWGQKDPDDEAHFPCNIWQGRFPDFNSSLDGWAATSPARSFAPNNYGLYNMVGNVWEWTADPFTIASNRKAARKKMETMRGFKLLKGGSFLCHQSYCYRYRIAARSGNSPESTTSHQGFRVVWDN